MKKYLMLLLTLALLLTGTALAEGEDFDVDTPRTGRAYCCAQSTNRNTPTLLFDEAGNVVMQYFRGVPVEVLSVLGNGQVSVRVGGEESAAVGLMNEKDLIYGPMGQRILPKRLLTLMLEGAEPVYADASGKPVDQLPEFTAATVIGWRDDGWFQLESDEWQKDVYLTGTWMNAGRTKTAKFIHPDEMGLHGDLSEYSWNSYPRCEGELTHEEAYEQVITYLSHHPEDPDGILASLPAGLRTEEGLRGMRADVRLSDTEKGIRWTVSLENPENVEENVTVFFAPDGTGEMEISRSWG